MGNKGELVALFLLSFGWHVTVNVLSLFVTVQWVWVQCVIVVFPDHTHLLAFVYWKPLNRHFGK